MDRWLSILLLFFFSSRRRHTRSTRDWSSDVCSSDLGKDPDELLRHMDIAMSAAKTSRGSVVRYHPELERGGANRLALMAELRRAIHDNRLVLHYQPLVDLRSGRLVMFLPLVCWVQPHRCVCPL